MNKKLSITDRNTAIKKLKGWQLVKDRNAISKTFEFKNFNAAFSWMTAMALHAEKLDHHPEWSNIYNKIHVILSTHDSEGVTVLDIEMATIMNNLYIKN
ncbi:MAG: 4a-hydroxytetrahydrobiopterin dehydratase [Pelagibacterales bacterium]|nr:4a-hydroxytetrahydrobiopterin dehydratase [Pelagibacterales bacterium]